MRSLGLRARISVSFALLGLVLSVGISLSAWLVVRTTLMTERTTSAVAEATVNAQATDRQLALGRVSLPVILDGLPGQDSSAVLVRHGRVWASSNPHITPDHLPEDLVTAASRGDAGTTTYHEPALGLKVLAAAEPMSHGDVLVELFPLDPLHATVRRLGWTLSGAAVLTTLAAALLGRLASDRALRPLTAVTDAARSIAGGRLDARLRPTGDPDLDPLAASFNDTAQHLEHRVIADARFAADVGHELRTPLTTMLNSVEVIRHRAGTMPPEVAETVELLAGDLDRFRRLVVDLLEVSRHDAGESLHLEPVDLPDLVRRAADRTAGRVVTTVAPDAVGTRMEVDKRRLERVVVNLVANADTHGGGCTGVHVARDGGAVTVTVDDAGPGIAQALRDQVFDRFSRGRSTPTPGLGLGLAIVQRHVAAHAGEVTIGTSPAGGARFVLRLPPGGPGPPAVGRVALGPPDAG
ncbi:sensor histidine kinase [Ornithinimicrobium avium]|uniref:histidine kinase n=1 Tax=Ornithinimicrobium avium TaxID=2283195 RepID=A0A345NMQ6_9MICO|nr:HAMP domain-containing sensor histidine kinase [Ornithinimicrobium avium]AXH96314.1 sensor histidine kinase [Ornithinimicrobium avium]